MAKFDTAALLSYMDSFRIIGNYYSLSYQAVMVVKGLQKSAPAASLIGRLGKLTTYPSSSKTKVVRQAPNPLQIF